VVWEVSRIPVSLLQFNKLFYNVNVIQIDFLWMSYGLNIRLPTVRYYVFSYCRRHQNNKESCAKK
jgi:hypothetical protein